MREALGLVAVIVVFVPWSVAFWAALPFYAKRVKGIADQQHRLNFMRFVVFVPFGFLIFTYQLGGNLLAMIGALL